jgi:hypothetical protein
MYIGAKEGMSMSRKCHVSRNGCIENATTGEVIGEVAALQMDERRQEMKSNGKDECMETLRDYRGRRK